jgi:hypothetical protein
MISICCEYCTSYELQNHSNSRYNGNKKKITKKFTIERLNVLIAKLKKKKVIQEKRSAKKN